MEATLASHQVQQILDKLEAVRQEKDGWVARCPSHADDSPSLRVSEGQDGKVLMFCRAGCTFKDIVTALGFTTRETSTQESKPKPQTSWGKAVAHYDYTDEAGVTLFQVVRDEHKNFRQRKPTHQEPPLDQWTYNVNGVRNVLYRLPEVMSASKLGVRTFLVEGEKDANTLVQMGLVATTCRGGAGKWSEDLTAQIEGKKTVVTILPDNDPAGDAHAKQVTKALKGRVHRVRTLRLPGLPPKGDVTDWVRQGGTKEQLLLLAEAGPETRGWSKAVDMVDEPTPDTVWAVQGMFSIPSLAMVSGDADAFKSWSMTDLCLTAATDRRWLGHFWVNAKKAMLVTADEDRAETRRKISWVMRGMELEEQDRENAKDRLLVWCDDLNFDDEESFERLLMDVEDFTPDIIVVDHLRVCFTGEENSSEFARNIKIRGRQIHRANPCALIWIHHFRKMSKEKEMNVARQRVRGTGGLVQAFDHHVAFEREAETDVAVVKVDRNKKGRYLSPFSIQARFLEPMSMAIIAYAGDAKLAAGTSHAPGKVLELLRSEKRFWTKKDLETTLQDELSKSTIRRALDDLLYRRLVYLEPSKGRNPSTVVALETNDWTWERASQGEQMDEDL